MEEANKKRSSHIEETPIPGSTPLVNLSFLLLFLVEASIRIFFPSFFFPVVLH